MYGSMGSFALASSCISSSPSSALLFGLLRPSLWLDLGDVEDGLDLEAYPLFDLDFPLLCFLLIGGFGEANNAGRYMRPSLAEGFPSIEFIGSGSIHWRKAWVL